MQDPFPGKVEGLDKLTPEVQAEVIEALGGLPTGDSAAAGPSIVTKVDGGNPAANERLATAMSMFRTLDDQGEYDVDKAGPDGDARVEDPDEPPLVEWGETYEVGPPGRPDKAKTFVLREPVLYQECQLLLLVRDSNVQLGSFDIVTSDLKGSAKRLAKRLVSAGDNVNAILQTFHDKLPQLFAILLTEDGVDLPDKDMTETARWLTYYLTLGQQGAVLASFFVKGKATLARVGASAENGSKLAS